MNHFLVKCNKGILRSWVFISKTIFEPNWMSRSFTSFSRRDGFLHFSYYNLIPLLARFSSPNFNGSFSFYVSALIRLCRTSVFTLVLWLKLDSLILFHFPLHNMRDIYYKVSSFNTYREILKSATYIYQIRLYRMLKFLSSYKVLRATSG